jgi:hypothetical protein
MKRTRVHFLAKAFLPVALSALKINIIKEEL